MHRNVWISSLLVGLFTWVLQAQNNKEIIKTSANPPKAVVLKNEFIFEKAPFLQCHAPTIVELKNGTIAASWFAGTYERHTDVAIYTSYLENDKWSVPKKVADGVQNDSLRYPSWNPVLFENNNGILFLYYKIGPSPSTWWGMYKTSKDNGEHWSAAIRLPDSILGPIKNKPVQLGNNLIVSPSSVESENGEVWKAHIEISKDGGFNWTRSEIPSDPEVKLIQPTILQLPSDSLKVLMRSNQNVLMESVSSDFGESWSKAKPTEIDNPNSGVDAVTLANGDFLLAYNPTHSGKAWSDGRQKLNLAYSTDGKHWVDILELENEDQGEFSYPAIIQEKSGLVHILYTFNRVKIKHVLLKKLD